MSKYVYYMGGKRVVEEPEYVYVDIDNRLNRIERALEAYFTTGRDANFAAAGAALDILREE